MNTNNQHLIKKTIYNMETYSLVTNGIPDNWETLSPERLQEFRLTCGHLLRPATVLRLLQPTSYLSGLIWELEEILKDKRQCINNSNMGAEQMRLSENEYSNEFDLNVIKNLFLRQKLNRIVSDSQLQVYDSIEDIHEVQETDAPQNFINFNARQNSQLPTSTTGEEFNYKKVRNQGQQPHRYLNCSSQNSLECQKEASQQGCSDTQNAFSVCCNNGESGISREKIISGFDNRCQEHIYKNKAIEGTEGARPVHEYTDSLSQDTVVKVEQSKLTQQNFNNRWMIYDNGNGSAASTSYVIGEIYQAPVLHFTAQSFNMLEDST